jgi:hypothetical protein
VIAYLKLRRGPRPGIPLSGRAGSASAANRARAATHNTNLVIDTDADQIIIAEVGAHTGDGLPPITYRSGGLDEAPIRKLVCDILEGGERAFQDRARRLRIALSR